jgi:hypothetical protein
MRKKFRAGPPRGQAEQLGHPDAPASATVQAPVPVLEAALAPESGSDELRRALRVAAEQGEALRSQLAERDAQFNALLSADQPTRGAARELRDLRRQVAAQGEALQRREARRQVYEALLREREALVDERDAQIEQLYAELQALQQQAMPERGMRGGRPAPAWAGLPEPAPAELAEARIASLASELARLHARAAVAPPAANEAVQPDPALQAELDELRRANEQLRAELAERDAQRASQPAPRDTGTFATTNDFSIAGAGESSVLSDGALRMFVRTEGDAGIVHVLGRRTTMGRTPDNDLCIDFESVSRHHAVALQTPAGTVIEDLNSTNGVQVNGHRVSRRLLVAGDVVTIGTASFRFLVKPADEAANS